MLLQTSQRYDCLSLHQSHCVLILVCKDTAAYHSSHNVVLWCWYLIDTAAYIFSQIRLLITPVQSQHCVVVLVFYYSHFKDMVVYHSNHIIIMLVCYNRHSKDRVVYLTSHNIVMLVCYYSHLKDTSAYLSSHVLLCWYVITVNHFRDRVVHSIVVLVCYLQLLIFCHNIVMLVMDGSCPAISLHFRSSCRPWPLI